MTNDTDRLRKRNVQLAAACVVILVLLGLAYLQFRAANENQTSAAGERNAYLRADSTLKSELRLKEAQILAERQGRHESDSLHDLEMTARMSDLNASKRRERSMRQNPSNSGELEHGQLIDSVYQKYDSALIAAEEQADKDSLSFEREIATLQAKTIDLTTAYNSTFSELLTVNDDLLRAKKGEVTWKKVSFWSILVNVLLIAAAFI